MTNCSTKLEVEVNETGGRGGDRSYLINALECYRSLLEGTVGAQGHRPPEGSALRVPTDALSAICGIGQAISKNVLKALNSLASLSSKVVSGSKLRMQKRIRILQPVLQGPP